MANPKPVHLTNDLEGKEADMSLCKALIPLLRIIVGVMQYRDDM